MKIAEIDWQLFWHALGQQRFTDRDRWLGRWVFADDGVRMSMQSAPSETGNSVHNNRSETPQDQMIRICFWSPTQITENRLHKPLALTTTIRLRDAGQQETYLNAVRREQDLADWSTREMWRDHFW